MSQFKNSSRTLVFALVQIAFAMSLFGKQTPLVTGKLRTSSVSGTTVTIGTASATNSVAVSTLSGTKDYNVLNTIALKYDLYTDTFFKDNAEVKVKVSIKRWDKNGTSLALKKDYLTIKVSNKIGQSTINQALLKLTDGYKVEVTIDSIWVNSNPVNTLPRYVSVEFGIGMDRYYDFATNSPAINLNTLSPVDQDCDGIYDELMVSWVPNVIAEEYQLEWTYVNNYSANGIGVYPASNYTTDFRHNSTRITTKKDAYNISLIFGKGYLACRIRTVGRNYLNPSEFVYGAWSVLDNVNMGGLNSTKLYTITQEHENDKNWQYSSTFAEEGKKKEVISYFDGSLHNRQSVTKVNSDNNVIVGETIYDYQGRPAVNVMPVPVVNICVVANSVPSIKYYPKFNVDDTNYVYSKNDFDIDASACNSSAAPMDTISGASKYYSTNNPDKQNQQAFLPHAKEYPFSQIEYTPDNTGRIRTQSGVGKDYQLGSGKETKYLYGQPNQIQVDRLFGSETGDASHYKKNVVIDANGQASITYLNQEGKAIATSLAGAPPTEGGGSTVTRMDSLDYANANQKKFTIDFFNKDANGNSVLNKIPASYDKVEFSTQLLVSYKSLYEFNYNFKVDTLNDPCLRNNVCLNCVYDLEIQVKDECGMDLTNSGNPIKKTTGKFTQGDGVISFNINCTSPTLYKDSVKFNLMLDPGVYTVSKTLSINHQAKDFYVKSYLDSANNKCVRTINQFIAAEMAKIDTMDCYNTCESCAQDLGDKDAFVSSGKGSALMYDLLLEKCLEPCRRKTLCDVTYEMMLSDVSPGGQYGKFNQITYDASNEPLSVFNTNNGLNANIIPGQYAHWKAPFMRLNGTVYNLYLDDEGNRKKIDLTETAPGVFVPPVSNLSLVYTDAASGNKYTYPENLANLSDFIGIWNSNFAKSLVVFHPEYAYYVSCSEQAVKFPGDTYTTDQIDSVLYATQSFNQAVGKFINSGYTNTTASAISKLKTIWIPSTTAIYKDPFFTNLNFQYSIASNPTTGTKTNLTMAGGNPFNVNLQAEMNYIINNYRVVGSQNYTMPEVAAMITRCGNNFGASPTNACKGFGTDYYPTPTALNDTIRNKEWRLFKQFYIAEKMKLQYKRMNFYAKYNAGVNSNYFGGCNACIGNSGYNPFASMMLVISSGLLPYPASAYFDLSQPCGYATNSNFGGKTKRFYDPANTGINTGDVGQQIYQTTGQCPLAFQLQSFLSGMTSSGRLTSATPVNLNTVDEFNLDLYNAVNNGITPSTYINYKWTVASSSGSLFTAKIVDPTTGLTKCTVTLDISGTAIPNFASIVNVTQLTADPSNGSSAFKAVAVYNVGSSVASANIKGTSCINIQDCNFAPQCTPNQFASEIGNMISFLAATNLLGSTSPISLSNDTTLKKLLTPSIKNTIGVPATPNVMYQFVSPNKYTFYENSNPNTKVVLTVTVNPSSVSSNIKAFANIRSNYNNLFKMDGMNNSNAKIADVDGKAEKIVSGQSVGLSMGECGLSEPPQCSQKEHKVRKDLEQLVKEILTTKPFDTNVDLYSLASFSSLLKSYAPTSLTSTNGTYTVSTAGYPNFDTLKINLNSGQDGSTGGCVFKLFHYKNDGSILNFPNITNISNLEGIGTPDIAGNYTNFKATATYVVDGSTRQEPIYGTSCWPIKNCIACPPAPTSTNTPDKMDSIYVSNGEAVFEKSLARYDTYKIAVDSMNIKLGWDSTNANRIEPMNYLTFAEKGYSNATQYVKFVTYFDILVDNKLLLKPETFVYSYGNLSNCNKEYSRYVNAIGAYNSRALSVSGATTFNPIQDSIFYSNLLCDRSFEYIKYLRKYPDAGLSAKEILPYFNITAPSSINTDSCKNLYTRYIKVHKVFLSNTTVQDKCKEADINHPLYSYEEILKANLCCTNQGLALFNSYINSLATASVTCPPALPTLTNCTTGTIDETGDKVCQKYYITFIQKLKEYNGSIYASTYSHSLNVDIYPTYASFNEAGLCNCILDYLNYLNQYISADSKSTLPLPVDINVFCSPTIPPPPTDSCRLLYKEYQQAINAYNNFVKGKENSGKYPPIQIVFDDDKFVELYCTCAKKFIAGLYGIINGTKPSEEELKSMLDLPSNCEKPCTNGPPDSAFVFPPYSGYVNPCMAQMRNLAVMNAQNAFSQYIDSMSTQIAMKYTKHCLGAVENYTYRYFDKEYHFTLYYYDQAGNLIKTIPPEGAEPINIVSVNDAIAKRINYDRTNKLQTVFTSHRMATTYVYNSLNQLIFQSIPDHDNMDICDGVNPNGLDTGLVINSVQFVNSSKGYLCGYIKFSNGKKRGYVYSSNDGGNYWTKVNGVTSGDLQKVQFVTANLGYAVSNFGMVFKTSDGGSSWDLLTSLYHYLSGDKQYSGTLNDLYFSSSFGVVCGNQISKKSFPLFYTTDAGNTFTQAKLNGTLLSGDSITGVSYDGTTYIASIKNGLVGKLLKSLDGMDWDFISNFSANNLSKVQFIDNNLAYAVGEEGTLLTLTNDLTPASAVPSWQLVPTNLLGKIRDVYFKNATDGISIVDSVSGKGKIWKTFNGGITWQILSAPGDYYNSLQLYDATQNRLIAAGQKGLLAKILLTNTPFGIVKINAANTNDYSYSDSKLYGATNSLRTIVVSDVSPSIHISYNVQATAPTWLTFNTTALSPAVPSADAAYKKVLMMDSIAANPYIKAIMLTANGKLYSLYKTNASNVVICRAVNVPGGFSGKFFNDITSNNQTFTAPVYAFDTINKKMYSIKFSGTVANASLISSSPNITKNINSIDINNYNDRLMMVGNSGHVEYSKNITAVNVTWDNASTLVTPNGLNDVKTVGSNDFMALGNDGTVWKNYQNTSNWYLKNSGTTQNLNSMAVNTSGTGLIAANNGSLYLLRNANTQAPQLSLVSTGINAHLTDVALHPTNTKAYVTAANGNVLFIPDYNIPVTQPAVSATGLPVNGVGFNGSSISSNALVVGNNVHVANYFNTSSMVTKNLFTKGLNSIHFYDANNGFVIDSNDVIRRTTNAGNNWSVVLPMVTSPALTKVFSTKANQAVVIGKATYAAVINNNALTQIAIPATIPNTLDFNDINFNDNKYGVIVCSKTRVAKIITNSMGTSFIISNIAQALSDAANTDFMSVHVFNNNSFIAAGTKGSIYYYKAPTGFVQQMSYNAPTGLTQANLIFNDVFFHDNYTGYVVGNKGAAYKVLLTDSIGGLGTTINTLGWQGFCSTALYLNYTDTAQTRKLNFNAIAFSNRTNAMIAGYDGNVLIGTIKPNRYARLLKEQSGYYSSRFWYDKLGRLVLSQNTKQFNKINPNDATLKQAFSYTLYDALGRIKEVGEKFENYTASASRFNSVLGSNVGGQFNNNAIDDLKFGTWINGNGTRREITKTYYDKTIIIGLPIIQENLRKRVATVTYEDIYDNNDQTYQNATHYSYDIHGNITMLWQDNKKLYDEAYAMSPTSALLTQRFKRIDYEYDFLSGKVNTVHYQKAQADAFHHHYEYDSDNRITEVYTSKFPNVVWTGIQDDPFWERDAKYFYYAHGPLARVEYGSNSIQGVDYAYTLQGWIKGVNSNALKTNRDMGKDGDPLTPNANGLFAKDAFGYTLNFYKGDYRAVDGLKWNNATDRFEAVTTASDLMNSRNDLYNGNITSVVTTILKPTLTATGDTLQFVPLPQGTAYRYDQLNRIKEMKAWQNLDVTNNTWNSGLTYNGMYNNKFTYDANGSMLTALAKNQTGQIIDNQTYHHQTIAGKKYRNRTYAITDAATQTSGNDLLNQIAFDNTRLTINNINNYSFTEIGERKGNKQDSIDLITWTVYGKIKEVKRRAGCSKYNLKFDYDASGNRVAKHIYKSDATTWVRSEYYIKDAQANILSTYEYEATGATPPISYAQTEKHIYGSSSIAIDETKTEMIAGIVDSTHYVNVLGNKLFNGSNHLGNVLVTFTDRKLQVDLNADNTVDEYWPHVVSSNDYAPFGGLLTERTFKKGAFPNSFNGKRDDEELNLQDYGMRSYNPQEREFPNVDPLSKKYPHYTPYQFAGNTPIVAIDLDGGEDLWVHFRENDDCSLTEVTSKTDISALTNDAISTSMGGANIPNTGVVYTCDHVDGTKSVRKVGETVIVSEFKDNLFVRGAKAADRFMASMKGDSYGEGEDWVKSTSFGAKASLSFNKYSVGIEGGLYSTSESNVGAYLNLNFDVAAKMGTDGLNLKNFKPDASAALFIKCNTGNEFDKPSVSNTTSLSGEGTIQYGLIGIGASGDKPLNGDKASGSFEIDFGKGKTGASGGIKNSTLWQSKTSTSNLGGR